MSSHARLTAMLLALAGALAQTAAADEGMWTFDNFPSATVREKYGVDIGAPWLNRVQRSITRHESGCTGSFVSGDGLVMTNHHCIRSCLEELSTPERDLLENPFVAKTHADELKCEKLELNQLVEITDVTERVTAATKGTSGAAFFGRVVVTDFFARFAGEFTTIATILVERRHDLAPKGDHVRRAVGERRSGAGAHGFRVGHSGRVRIGNRRDDERMCDVDSVGTEDRRHARRRS